jgi:hypothetical protein
MTDHSLICIYCRWLTLTGDTVDKLIGTTCITTANLQFLSVYQVCVLVHTVNIFIAPVKLQIRNHNYLFYEKKVGKH